MAYRTPPFITPFAIVSIALALGATNVVVNSVSHAKEGKPVSSQVVSNNSVIDSTKQSSDSDSKSSDKKDSSSDSSKKASSSSKDSENDTSTTSSSPYPINIHNKY